MTSAVTLPFARRGNCAVILRKKASSRARSGGFHEHSSHDPTGSPMRHGCETGTGAASACMWARSPLRRSTARLPSEDASGAAGVGTREDHVPVAHVVLRSWISRPVRLLAMLDRRPAGRRPSRRRRC